MARSRTTRWALGPPLALLFLWVVTALQSATASSSSSSSVGVTEALEAAQSVLQQYQQTAAGATEKRKVSDADSDGLEQQYETVRLAADRYAALHETREALIRQANVRQIQHLVSRLQSVSQQEQARREAKKNRKDAESSGGDSSNNNNETSTTIPSDWEDQLDPTVVLQEAEAELEAWIDALMRDELAVLEQQLQAEQPGGDDSVDDDDDDECLTAHAAVTEVHAALNRFARDFVGRTDVLQQPGAAIVHELTSATYRPPPMDDATLSLFQKQQELWQRYVPEDWEAAWQWLTRQYPALRNNVPSLVPPLQRLVPDHVYHSLGMVGAATTAPPETILQDSLWPGACWPAAVMDANDSNAAAGGDGAASSRSVVTIRLAQPVSDISAVTLDHVSSRLVEDRSSAPHQVRVYGYPPCLHDGCNGLGFDVASKFVLADLLEYDIEADEPIQTFDISTTADAAAPPPSSSVEEGSCAAPADTTASPGECGSSSAAATKVVAAVSLEILSNHGNPDYTCLYRFRVHADGPTSL